MISRKLRRSITSLLPPRIITPARQVARVFDQMIGLMGSSRRPGVIAMYHVGRCGSTVIGQLIDQHPKVFWDGEIYFQKWKESKFKFETFSNVRFLRRRMLASSDRYYGFELKFLDSQHLAIINSSIEKVVDDFIASGVNKHIILERKNYLRMLISWVVGRQRMQHHIKSDEKAILTKVRLEANNLSFGTIQKPKSLIDWFQTIEDAYRNLRLLLSETENLDLIYEADIENDPYIAYRRVCSFLGLEEKATELTLSRTNPFPVADMLDNYDQIVQILRGTKYEWMLDKQTH